MRCGITVSGMERTQLVDSEQVPGGLQELSSLHHHRRTAMDDGTLPIALSHP